MVTRSLTWRTETLVLSFLQGAAHLQSAFCRAANPLDNQPFVRNARYLSKPKRKAEQVAFRRTVNAAFSLTRYFPSVSRPSKTRLVVDMKVRVKAANTLLGANSSFGADTPLLRHQLEHERHPLVRAIQSGSIGTAPPKRLLAQRSQQADRKLKRCVDLAVALVALALTLPLMLVIAVAIKIESRGPVLFTQIRHGYNKRQFRILKFRTMKAVEDCDRFRQATAHDSRITRMGKLMRKLNLDELPQLINVLRNEMSLVGPRPHAVSHDQEFASTIAMYERRHAIMPGITGWAQVNGLRGPTDTADKIARRVMYDLHYLENQTVWLDIRILALTLFSRSAYRNAF